MSGLVFSRDERESVERVGSLARDALAPLGVWPSGGGYLSHRRAVVRATRSASGRKATHSRVAAASLEWARDAGDVDLYVLVALAVGIEAEFGEEGMERALSAFPDLAAGRDAVPAMTEALRAALVARPSNVTGP